ncbi:MAG: sensor histidine kinase [Ignavibacteriae bacterium HGW-Ignavibacteriae-2]|nr:MAG: sensor histidine kinase [Ignavibacteriae bacterium HGW-Ignavibacteriae-2]
MNGGPASMYLKLILLVIASFIAAGTLIYTQQLVNDLQERERQIVKLYASSLESVARDASSGVDFTFQLDIIKRINFPLILAEVDSNNLALEVIGQRNVLIDSTMSHDKIESELLKLTEELKKLHDPILIIIPDAHTRQAVFYGDSILVTKLMYYPYLQIIFAIIFILIFYVSFSYMKRNEQSNIWVGMAKETAHQLGTPISSLMGWQEILKMSYDKADNVLDVANEMENDLVRLNKITNRFSKIGSKPELKEEFLYEVIDKVLNYFKRRIPQSSKKVSLSVEGDRNLKCKINHELFEWVIENLIKNALDAMDNERSGLITIKFQKTNKHIEIDIIDNGKGIDLRRRKDVFRPGYSTKKRGWGLGLSLARRIIENYHKGKISVKSSVQNEGTVFQIILPKY